MSYALFCFLVFFVLLFFFFFSSRRRHTRCLSDWSSDVCSSDLRRARTDSYALRLPRDLRHSLLEGCHLAALGDPPTANDLGHSLGFGLAERRAGMGDERLVHTRSAPILMNSRSGTNASAALTRP